MPSLESNTPIVPKDVELQATPKHGARPRSASLPNSPSTQKSNRVSNTVLNKEPVPPLPRRKSWSEPTKRTGQPAETTTERPFLQIKLTRMERIGLWFFKLWVFTAPQRKLFDIIQKNIEKANETGQSINLPALCRELKAADKDNKVLNDFINTHMSKISPLLNIPGAKEFLESLAKDEKKDPVQIFTDMALKACSDKILEKLSDPAIPSVQEPVVFLNELIQGISGGNTQAIMCLFANQFKETAKQDILKANPHLNAKSPELADLAQKRVVKMFVDRASEAVGSTLPKELPADSRNAILVQLKSLQNDAENWSQNTILPASLTDKALTLLSEQLFPPTQVQKK